MPIDPNGPASILETYINAKQQKFNNDQLAAKNAADIAQTQSDTEYRENLAKQTAIQLETEHERNLQALGVQQAQLDLAKEQLKHAHLQSVMDIQKGITEGSVPVPPTQFQPNPSGPNQINQGTDDQPILVNGQNVKQPLTYGGVTLQPNEYNTPADTVAQTKPLISSQIQNQGDLAYKQAQGTALGTQEVNQLPGGAYQQAAAMEDLKTKNAQIIADKAADRAETVANINSAARKYVGNVTANSRITAAGIRANTAIDPGEVSDRAQSFAYGEAAPGQKAMDLHAVAALHQAGINPVDPKVITNLKAMVPLQSFSDEMKAFANKYLTDQIAGSNQAAAAANWAKISTPGSDANNDYNKLLLQATNISKSVEGATGRILLPQLNAAKAFIANKLITKSQMLDNASKLDTLNINAIDGQLGNQSPARRVDILGHYDLDKFMDLEQQRWNVPSKGGQVSAPNNTIPQVQKKPLPDGFVPLGVAQ